MQLKPNSAAPISKRYKEQARAFHMGAGGSPQQGLLIGHWEAFVWNAWEKRGFLSVQFVGDKTRFLKEHKFQASMFEEE